MAHVHVPQRLVQISRSFKGTDPTAWVLALVAVVSVVLVVALAWNR
jgi:hypothetical protein